MNLRIADSEIRELVVKALDECRVFSRAPTDNLREARKQAADATYAALEALGKLIRQLPSA